MTRVLGERFVCRAETVRVGKGRRKGVRVCGGGRGQEGSWRWGRRLGMEGNWAGWGGRSRVGVGGVGWVGLGGGSCAREIGWTRAALPHQGMAPFWKRGVREACVRYA